MARAAPSSIRLAGQRQARRRRFVVLDLQQQARLPCKLRTRGIGQGQAGVLGPFHVGVLGSLQLHPGEQLSVLQLDHAQGKIDHEIVPGPCGAAQGDVQHH